MAGSGRLKREQSMWVVPSSAFRSAVVPAPDADESSTELFNFRRRRGRAVVEDTSENSTRPSFVPETRERGFFEHEEKERSVPDAYPTGMASHVAGLYPVYGRNGASGGMNGVVGGKNRGVNGYGAHAVKLPPVPRDVREVEALGKSEMDDMLHDQKKLNKFIMKLPQYRAIVDKVDKLSAEVDDLEVQVEQLQQQRSASAVDMEISNLRAKEAALKSELKDLHAKKDAWLSRNTSAHLMERLKTSVNVSDTTSQQIKDEYMAGGMKCSEFVRRYMNERCSTRQRRIKLEQYQHELGKVTGI